MKKLLVIVTLLVSTLTFADIKFQGCGQNYASYYFCTPYEYLTYEDAREAGCNEVGASYDPVANRCTNGGHYSVNERNCGIDITLPDGSCEPVIVNYFTNKNDLVLNTPYKPMLCPDDTKSGNAPSTYTTNPINTTDGNKTRQENDFIASGLSPLNFIRYYSSNKNKDSGIGINWSHSYTASLTANIHTAATPYVAGDSNFSGLNSTAALACTSGWNDIKTTYNKPELASSTAVYLNNECSIEDGSGQALGSIAVRDNSTGGVSPNPPQDNIVIERANGNTIIFTLINSVWTPPTDSDVSLVQTTTGYTLTTAQDTVEEYNLTGQLISSTDRKGIQQTLTYHPTTGLLETVTDAFGSSLGFAYVGNNLSTVTLPDATQLVYSYDANNNFSSVKREDNSVKTYVYEDLRFPHALTGIIDENLQRHMTFSYDALGRATTSELGDGVSLSAEKVTIEFIDDATSTVTDGLGKVRTYRFAMINGEKKLTDIEGGACASCGGGSTKTTYDVNGYVETQTDFNGVVTHYINNARGLVTTLTEAVATKDERVSTYTWHPQYALPTCVIQSVRTTALAYTADGSVETRRVFDTSNSTLFATPSSKTCDAIIARADVATLNQRHTAYTYTPNYGLLETIDGPRTDVNDVTTFGYDVNHRLSNITNALGHVTELKNYTLRGQPQTLIDANGLTTSITYDVRGRVDVVTVGSQATNYDFDVVGLLDKVTRPDGSVIDYDYDAAHRLTDIRDQLGNHIHYTLDALGNITITDVKDDTGALKRHSEATYNQLSQLEKTIGAALQTTNYVLYDGNGNLKHLQDAEGKSTLMSYDALNRLETSTNALLDTSTTVYDTQNNIISVTDLRGLNTTYQYDGLGNRTQQNSPDTGITNYTAHDGAGNVLSMVDANNQTTTYAYDVLNRIDLVTYDDASLDDYVYDLDVNGKGRLSSVSYTDLSGLNAGSTNWTYDVYGYVQSKTETVNAIALTTTYQYNPITGQLDNVITPSGKTLAYHYMAAKVTSITVDGQTVMSGITYDPFGPANAWLWGNGSASNRVYDQDGQLDTYTSANTTYDINYTLTGNVKSITDLTMPANDQSFNYDGLHRIKNYSSAIGSEVYDYDANSNRTVLTDALTAQNESYVIDPLSNKISSIVGLSSVNYAYSANGNITFDGVHSYAYDARNRLISVDANQAVYQLNALGQRVQKNVAGTLTLFHYNEQGQLVAEADAQGTVTKEYIYFNGQPIAINVLTPQISTDYVINSVDALGNTATWQIDPVNRTLMLNAPAQGINTSFNITADNWFEEPDLGQASRDLVLRVNMPDGRMAIGLLTITGPNLSGRFMLYTPPTAAQYVGQFEVAGFNGSTLFGKETLTGLPASLQFNPSLNTLAITEPTGIMSGNYPIEASNIFTMATPLGNATLIFYSDLPQQRLLTALFMENNGLVAANAYAQLGAYPLTEYAGTGTTDAPALSTIYPIHTDHLGTPRAITDVNNTTLWSWHSDPFGKTAANEDPDNDGINFTFNLRFAGQYYDAESGLHYNYFRDYDPSTGRYVQSDPIGLSGGLNTYGYVGGNPLYYTDPYGLMGTTATWATRIGGIGVGLIPLPGMRPLAGAIIAMTIPGDTPTDGSTGSTAGGTGDYCSNNPEDPICDSLEEPKSCKFGKNTDKKIRKHINQVRNRYGSRQDIPSPSKGGNEMVRDIVNNRVKQGGGVYKPYSGQPAFRYADGKVEYVIRPNGKFWTILRK